MNLQIRMDMRRFTRLTNAHSKKIENHRHALALYFMYYNFARVHATLRVTPAMQAEVTDHVWSLEGIVRLLDWLGGLKTLRPAPFGNRPRTLARRLRGGYFISKLYSLLRSCQEGGYASNATDATD
jgi:hypothetical protein